MGARKVQSPVFIPGKKETRLQIGPLLIIMRKPNLVIFIVDETHPYMCGKRRAWAQHLTFCLPKGADNERPEYDLRPHLTQRRTGGKTKHKFLGRMTVDQLGRFFKAFEKQMFDFWIASTRPVTLAELQSSGYVALVPTNEQRQAFMKSLQMGPAKFGFRHFEKLIDPYADLLESALSDPMDLNMDALRDGPVHLLRTDEEHEFELVGFLGHYPHGLPSGDWKPGWYLTNPDWLNPDLLRSFLIEYGGAKLQAALNAISAGLGLAKNV